MDPCTLRRLVNEEATEDLLGADWRTSDRTSDTPSTHRAEHEAFWKIQELLDHTTPGEREVMQAFLETDGDIHLMAEQLQRTPQAIKQGFCRKFASEVI